MTTPSFAVLMKAPKLLGARSERRACPCCGHQMHEVFDHDPYATLPWVRTRGHIVGKSPMLRGVYRPWLWQCLACNAAQKGRSLAAWRDRLVAGARTTKHPDYFKAMKVSDLVIKIEVALGPTWQWERPWVYLRALQQLRRPSQLKAIAPTLHVPDQQAEEGEGDPGQQPDLGVVVDHERSDGDLRGGDGADHP